MTPLLSVISVISIATTTALACCAFAIISSARRRMRRAELRYVVVVGVIEEPAFKDALDAARGWVRK